MRTFLTGATGLLGRRVVRELLARKHEVAALARSDANEQALRAMGAEPRRADLFDRASLEKAAAGADAVFHLATAVPRSLKSRSADWAANDRIRRDGTAALLAAAPKDALLVVQSIGLVYGQRKGLVRESAEPAAKPHPWVASAVDMERAVRESGRRAAILRCGLFYAADDPRTQEILARVRARRLPYIGDGDNLVSWVHLDDAAPAFALAAEKGATGPFNVSDDRPVTSKEFAEWLATETASKGPWDVPRWVAWLAMGPTAFRATTTSLALENTKAREELGWTLQYPTFREGWSAILGRKSRLERKGERSAGP
jgi:nucleoside-diphosphate-sugar epimerase